MASLLFWGMRMWDVDENWGLRDRWFELDSLSGLWGPWYLDNMCFSSQESLQLSGTPKNLIDWASFGKSVPIAVPGTWLHYFWVTLTWGYPSPSQSILSLSLHQDLHSLPHTLVATYHTFQAPTEPCLEKENKVHDFKIYSGLSIHYRF